MKWTEHKEHYGEYFFTEKCTFVKDGVAGRANIKPLIEALARETGGFKSVIDCGCATGSLLLGMHLFDASIELYGFDLGEYAISRAHDEIKDSVELLDCATANIPFPDRHFDLCVAMDFYEHQHDDYIDHVIEETTRVTAKYIFIRQPFVHFHNIRHPEYVENLMEFIVGFNDMPHLERLALIDSIPGITSAFPDPTSPYHPQEHGRAFFLELFQKQAFDEIHFSEDFYKMPNCGHCSSFTTMVLQRQE